MKKILLALVLLLSFSVLNATTDQTATAVAKTATEVAMLSWTPTSTPTLTPTPTTGIRVLSQVPGVGTPIVVGADQGMTWTFNIGCDIINGAMRIDRTNTDWDAFTTSNVTVSGPATALSPVISANSIFIAIPTQAAEALTPVLTPIVVVYAEANGPAEDMVGKYSTGVFRVGLKPKASPAVTLVLTNVPTQTTPVVVHVGWMPTPTIAIAVVKQGNGRVKLSYNSLGYNAQPIAQIAGTPVVSFSKGSTSGIVSVQIGASTLSVVQQYYDTANNGALRSCTSNSVVVRDIDGWNCETTKAQLEAADYLTGATTTFTSKYPSADSRYAWAVSFAEDRLVLDIKIYSTAAAMLQVDTATNSTTAAGKAVVDIAAATALGTANLNGSAGFIYVPAGTFVGVTLTAGASTDEVRTIHYHTIKLSDLAKLLPVLE